MTIDSTASILLAMYVALARKQGADTAKLNMGMGLTRALGIFTFEWACDDVLYLGSGNSVVIS